MQLDAQLDDVFAVRIELEARAVGAGLWYDVAARRDNAWMRRAATSLPEPDGPVMRMRLRVGATLSMS